MILEIVTHSILLEAMSVDEITRCTIIERKGVEEKQNIWEELYSGFRLYFAWIFIPTYFLDSGHFSLKK